MILHEKIFREIKVVFSVFSFSFLTRKCKKYIRKHVLLLQKRNHKRAARVFLVQCAVEKSETVCAWPALPKQSQF